MGQNNIGLRFSVDVSQAKGQVEELSKTIAGLKEQIAQATKASDWKTVAQLTQAMYNTTTARGHITQQAKQVESIEARETKKNGGIFGGEGSEVGKYLLAQTLTKLTDGIIHALEKGFEAATQRAGGDLTGAAVTEKERDADVASNTIGLLTTFLATYFTRSPMAGAFVGGLSEKAANWILKGDVRDIKEDLQYSAQYKKIFPEIDTLNQIYGGDINKNTPEENNAQGLEMYGRATEATEGTGLTTGQLVEAMKQVGSHGVTDENQALDMAQNQALWSRFTGADLSTIQKYAGQSYRYGGDTGAVSTAYGSMLASGMGKGQFSEFLNSMARILEEGISKGFVRSSDQIASNMAMLYKLSGNSSLWQGEQGAQRLSQMNNAIANATRLESVEDVMSFSVARDIFKDMDETGAREFLEGDRKNGKDKGGRYTGTYVDYMQLLERGADRDLLERQFDAVRDISGGDTATMIERFRNMYGLNYTGAAQVWDMADEWKKNPSKYTPEEIEKTIKEMQAKPEYASDSALLQKTMNDVAKNLATIGQIKFSETEMELLKTQADNVEAIKAAVIKEKEEKNMTKQLEEVVIPKVNEAGSPITNTITLEMAKYYGSSERGINSSFEKLSNAAFQDDDLNDKTIAERYNKEINPMLKALGGDISESIVIIMHDLLQLHNDSTSGFTKNARRVDDREADLMNAKMDELIVELKNNTKATKDNTDTDKDIYVSAP